jgi:hypothetical protein
MNGVDCAKCGYRIYPNEVMIMISLTRMDDNVYMHLTCFTHSVSEKVAKDLDEKWDIISILKFEEKDQKAR